MKCAVTYRIFVVFNTRFLKASRSLDETIVIRVFLWLGSGWLFAYSHEYKYVFWFLKNMKKIKKCLTVAKKIKCLCANYSCSQCTPTQHSSIIQEVGKTCKWDKSTLWQRRNPSFITSSNCTKVCKTSLDLSNMFCLTAAPCFAELSV